VVGLSSWGSYKMHFLIVVCARQFVFLTLFPGFLHLQFLTAYSATLVFDHLWYVSHQNWKCKLPGNVSNQNYKQSKTGDVEGPGVYTIKVEAECIRSKSWNDAMFSSYRNSRIHFCCCMLVSEYVCVCGGGDDGGKKKTTHTYIFSVSIQVLLDEEYMLRTCNIHSCRRYRHMDELRSWSIKIIM